MHARLYLVRTRIERVRISIRYEYPLETPICSGRRRTRSRPQNGRLIKAVRFGIPVDTEFRWFLLGPNNGIEAINQMGLTLFFRSLLFLSLIPKTLTYSLTAFTERPWDLQVGPTTKGLKTLFAPSAATPCPPSIVSDNQDASNRLTRPKGRANEPNFVFHFILIPTKYSYLFQSSYIFFFSSSFSLVSPIERIPIQMELFTKGAYTLTIDNTNTLMILINSRISFSSYLEKLYRIYGNVDYMTPLSLMNLLR
ncbi:hypothetical protein V1477_020045 [Vespula maculifrons]|uniref:Uncharacterized protein n=1 Tax=Vespula maculifrons TaxID=7453 RepID=A0ABD2AN06_VESMC